MIEHRANRSRRGRSALGAAGAILRTDSVPQPLAPPFVTQRYPAANPLAGEPGGEQQGDGNEHADEEKGGHSLLPLQMAGAHPRRLSVAKNPSYRSAMAAVYARSAHSPKDIGRPAMTMGYIGAVAAFRRAGSLLFGGLRPALPLR